MGFFNDAFDSVFNSNSRPYGDAMDQYSRYADQASAVQKPYQQWGQEGMGQYGDWMNKQKDPGQFINNLMGQYQQSPYNQYLQQQSARSSQNAASAAGLGGSTPLFNEIGQNSANIAQGGIDNWLTNALGINTQYGQASQNRVNIGQNSANQLSNLYSDQGQNTANLKFGQSKGKMTDMAANFGGFGQGFSQGFGGGQGGGSMDMSSLMKFLPLLM